MPPMRAPHALAAVYDAYIPGPPLPTWFPWAALGAALLFVFALTLALVIIARRSRWPQKEQGGDQWTSSRGTT